MIPLTEREIKYNLLKRVHLKLPRHYIDGGGYILTGATIRKDPDTGKFYYDAELSEIKSGAIYIAKLSDISRSDEN